MEKSCTFHKVAWVLLFIGGLNWGLVGGFHLNLVEMVLGSWPVVVRVVYILVGVAALSMLGYAKCCGNKCGGTCSGSCKDCGCGKK